MWVVTKEATAILLYNGVKMEGDKKPEIWIEGQEKPYTPSTQNTSPKNEEKEQPEVVKKTSLKI